MAMTAYRTISADSHVVEPRDLWENYIEPGYRDRAPHVEQRGDHEIFLCEGTNLPSISLLAAAGVSSDRLVALGTYDRDCPKGAWDPHARLGEMDVDRVEAEVIYPSIAMGMYSLADIEFQGACFRAYNSWMADFCKPYPDRLKGLGLISLEDIEASVLELRRCRDIGLAGAAIAVLPDEQAPYDSPVYEPFWAAAAELALPISLHVGTERNPVRKTDVGYLVSRSIDNHIVQESIATLVFGGVFLRFPGLRVVSAENDIGWAGYLVERMDYLFNRRKSIAKLPINSEPSEFFHRNVFLTFMRDRSGMLVRNITGVPNIMWASDYPHMDSTWPKSMEVLDEMMGDVPEDEERMIRSENAARLYGFSL